MLGSRWPGLLHSCTALTRLELRQPTLLLSKDSVSGPAAGVSAGSAQLQELTIDLPCRLLKGFRTDHEVAQELGRLLPYLTSLTCLDLGHSYARDVGGRMVRSCLLQHISTLVRLNRLQLADGQGPISASTLPGIERLTALHDLRLARCDLELACLLPMTIVLTGLHLAGVGLLQDGASQLLQLLARLPALRVLVLDGAGGAWPQQLSLYSALTASSNLQELEVFGCDFPKAAWVHVFPAGRQLLHLTSLSTHTLFSEEIAHLADCCQALRHLTVTSKARASMAPLTSLTALTSLKLYDAHPSAVWRLAELTQLQTLHLSLEAQDAGTGLHLLVPLRGPLQARHLMCGCSCWQNAQPTPRRSQTLSDPYLKS